MRKIKAEITGYLARMKELAKNNPVLWVTATFSLIAIATSVILISADILRGFGYLLMAFVVAITLLPDTVKNCLLGLILGKKPPQENYPVLIGWNGNRFVPEYIEEAFNRLSGCFDSIYFMDVDITDNLVEYHFVVHNKTSGTKAGESTGLLQAISEKVLRHQFSTFMQYHPDYSALTYTHLNDPYLSITYARNEHGAEQIQQAKEQYRRIQYEEEHPDAAAAVITETWRECPAVSEGIITYGYDLQRYEEYGIKSPVLLPLSSHPHALIVGSSGSGKSKALIFLIGRLLQAQPDIDLWICDFKNSTDFAFLDGYSHYYTGNDCYQGITDYYAVFSQARQSGTDDRRHLLIFDEYPASVLYYQAKDKQEKTKKAVEILSDTSEILMLGRGTCHGYGIWTVCQRADSSWFPAGARDNYMISLCLGRISKEQQGMLFPGEGDNIPDRVYMPGEGILLADGKPLQTVKIPLVEDTEDWNAHIKAILAPN